MGANVGMVYPAVSKFGPMGAAALRRQGMSREEAIAAARPAAEEANRNSDDPRRVMGQLYRDEWNDYVTRFFPREEELIATYDNPEVHARVIGEATQQAAAGFDASRASYGRGMARFGMPADPTVRAETDRAFDLGKALAVVDAKNRTRQGLVERDAAMLAGGLTTGAKLKREGEG